MLTTVLELLLAPALAGAAGLAARRWRERAAGFVSAFPAIVGPLLLVAADEHGAAFAAETAAATLLGLVALSAFGLAYGRAAVRGSWPVALGVAWSAAAVVAAVASAAPVAVGPAAGTAVAAGSLLLARRALPAAVGGSPVPLALREIPVRMALTAALIVALALAAGRFGATVAGVLAGLPVLASVLAATTHRRQGRTAALELLDGMLAGLGGFVAFCAVFAATAVPWGVAPAFAAATAACLAVQAAAYVAGADRSPGLPAVSAPGRT